MANLSEEQFIDLVKKSEAEANTNIDRYKTKLALFAILGYVVIFFVITALIALVGGTLAIAMVSSSLFLLLIKKKIIFVIAFAVWTLLRALWVKFDEPTGYRLSRDEFPTLFNEIDQLTKSLDALTIHQVILNNELNAAVVQSPKFGILGGQRNTLMLGIQLLLALSAEEMRSVLAHEFGHLSGNHSRFSGWIYRIRITWQRVMYAFDNSNSFGAGLMRRFFDWYAPKFSAYSFALARNNEYEADRMAAELTSPNTAAKALINVYTKAPYIEQEFWDVYFKTADSQPQPANPPFEGLAEFLKKSPITREKLLELIGKEMSCETHYADTHPALKDRVTMLTDDAVIPDTFNENAAEEWLGEKYQYTLTYFDNLWMENNQQRWQQRYEYVQASKATLDAAKDKAIDSFSDDDLWELAQLHYEFTDEDAALPFYQQLHHRKPELLGPNYYIGLILSNKKDISAVDYLRKALSGPQIFNDVANIGYTLVKEIGNEQQLDQWQDDIQREGEKHQAIYDARTTVTIKDDYKATNMPSDTLARLKEILSSNKNVGSVWLAEKHLPFDDVDPVYIFAYKIKGIALSDENVTEKLSQSIDIDEDIYIVCLSGEQKKFAKKIKKIGTQIQ